MTWAASLFSCRESLSVQSGAAARFEPTATVAATRPAAYDLRRMRNIQDARTNPLYALTASRTSRLRGCLLRAIAVVLSLGAASGFAVARSARATDRPQKKNASQDKSAPPDKGEEARAPYMVARDVIQDPFFRQSAVLMLPDSVGAPLVVGLIINKPVQISLADVFPDDKALAAMTDMIYFGGPVDPDSIGAVFRTQKPPKAAIALFGDVYATFDEDTVKDLLKKKDRPQELRLFLGRAQWSPTQLQNEALAGSWYNLQGPSNLIFSAEPRYVWRTLFQLAEPSPLVRVVPAGRAGTALVALSVR